ncbi:hypothetical protein, partial [Pseudomonas shirazensis]
KNSTFCGADPGWANACVGNNGSPGYYDYAKGFSKAANVLIDQVIAGRGNDLSVDDFVYPVCFNMRHSVELRLKGAIEELAHVSTAKGQALKFDLVGSHDIGNIWNFFKRESEALDKRYTEINDKIDSTISDIAEVDATGQVFRYPESNDNQKHLTDVASINFCRLKIKFAELEKGLDLLHSLNVCLREEYFQGTFTLSFSRPMLYGLALELPAIATWSNPEFGAVKRSLMDKYDVGSRELSRAIDKIKAHYYLSSLIGAPLPLKGLVREQLLEFFDYWVPENPDIQREPEGEEVFSFSE